MSGLDGVMLKIERAKRHHADLEQALEPFYDLDADAISFEPDCQPGEYVYRVNRLPAVDPSWGLLVGDCLHNLRSALDHLAWQIVDRYAKKAPNESTSFPIHESPLNDNGKRRLCALNPSIKNRELIKTIERVQPYNGPDGDYRRSHLWTLNKLNNIDKHRLLLVMSCALNRDNMWWATAGGETAPAVSYSTDGLKEGDVLARVDFGASKPDPNFNAHPAVQVVLDESAVPITRYVAVGNLLAAMIYFVEFPIIEVEFRQFFG